MARKSLYNYIFVPGAANSGKVIIPDPYKLGDILMITNVTKNQVIYNFGDPNRGAYLFAYTNATDVTDVLPAGVGGLGANQAIFSNLNNGYTTLTLALDTSGMAATDVLQIYVEATEMKVRPYDFGVDAVERMKIAAPQSLIDADFEYGPQPTKWTSFATYLDQPMGFETPGTDITTLNNSYVTFLTGSGPATPGWITGPTTGTIVPLNQGFDGASTSVNAQMGPRTFADQYTLIIAQGQAGMANAAAGTTAITSTMPIAVPSGGIYQRTFTVANTAGWYAGDVMCVVEMPGEGVGADPAGSKVAALTLSVAGGQTAGNTQLATNVALTSNTIMLVETSNFGVWEAMATGPTAVTTTTGSTANVVMRNLWGTNQANASIPFNARVRLLGGTTPFNSNANVELMRVDSVDSNQQFTVTRGWMNTNTSPTFGANSIVFKVNTKYNTPNNAGLSITDSANVEIVRTIGTPAVANAQIGANPVWPIRRAQLGTQALPAAGPGSIALQLSGVFATGNTSVPSVTIFAPGHGLGQFSNVNVANAYVSTIGFSQAVTVSNVEGVYVNRLNDTNYVSYFPKVNPNQFPGTPLNVNDAQTIVRRGGVYSGANVWIANVTSNIGSPSLMTMTTWQPHGILPGTIVQSVVQSSAGLLDAASGQFVVATTPTPTSFTYVAKPNIAVVTNGIQGLVANVTPFSLGLVKHRPIDGGNNIGTNTLGHGFEQTRQTKKAFRYQSGKGIMFTTGTQFNPVFTMANISANSVTSGSGLITIVTENEHGLQPNANVTVYGVTTSGYNNYYSVANVTSVNTFTVFAKSTLGAVQPVWGFNNQGVTPYAGRNFPRVVITNWHGSRIRSGIFDDGNGVFYEYDGQTFWAVKRNSVMDLAGRVNAQTGSYLITGDTNTRFVDQLIQGDQIIIRGMTHTVTQVVNQNTLYMTPAYRGLVNAQDVRYTTIKEERTPQKFFNMDRVDGTGPSGYVMNLTKMQMIGIQYTWYGAGFVDYMVRAVDGKMVIMHRSKGNNVNDEAYMRTGNLPARYQASNKGPRTWLSKAVPPTESTEIQLYDVSEFPTATVAGPVTIQIDNEFITYTSGPFTANGNIAGLQRGASINPGAFNNRKTLWMGSNAGYNWVNGAISTPQNWSSIVFNPNENGGNGIFFAIAGYNNAGTSQATAYSLDGQTWYAGPNLPSSSAWFKLAYGNIGGTDYYVAVSQTSGTVGAYLAVNTLTNQALANWNAQSLAWAPVTMPTTGNWTGLAFGADNQGIARFVATAGGGAGNPSASTASAYSSGTNGAPTAFTLGGALSSGNWVAVAFGKTTTTTSTGGVFGAQQVPIANNYFVAVSQTATTTAIAYSTNGGLNWNSVTITSQGFSDIAFGQNTWIATTGAYASGGATVNFQWCFGNPQGPWTQGTTLPVSTTWRQLAYLPYPWTAQGAFFAISDTLGAPVAYVNNMASVTIGTAPTWGLLTSPTSGQQYSAIGAGQGTVVTLGNVLAQTHINTSTNVLVGGNLVASGTLPNRISNWGNAAAYGAGIMVTLEHAVSSGGAAGANVAYSFNGGRTWANTINRATGLGALAGSGAPGAGFWNDMVYAPDIGTGHMGRFLAVQGNTSTTAAMLPGYIDAATILQGPESIWSTGGALPTIGTGAGSYYSAVTYINGVFATIANNATTAGAAYSNNGGLTWTAQNTNLTASQWSAMASGWITSGVANAAVIVAVSTTAGQAVAVANVQITGGTSVLSNWSYLPTALPTGDTWTSVAFGAGTFVAIAGNTSATGGQRTAYSTDGRTWSAGGNLPSTGYWKKVVYGTNGVWVALQNSVATARTTAAAYSINGGVTWTAATLPVSDYWQNVLFAPQFGTFAAIAGGAGQDGYSLSANVAVSLNTGGIPIAHTANTGARVVSVTASPDLNHWGSAVILDGGFTTDRSYTFTYNLTNFSVTPIAAPQTVFMMRLAPSLSNAITGELGFKDLINRAQILLVNMYINVNQPGSRYLLQGLLNPSNILAAQWQPLNSPTTYLQPSFTQFVANSGGRITFQAMSPGQGVGWVANAAAGGEQLFSIPVTQTNSGFLDLSNIKELTSMVLPGTGSFPNGNEILAINLIPVNPQTANNNGNVDVQMTYVESQA